MPVLWANLGYMADNYPFLTICPHFTIKPRRNDFRAIYAPLRLYARLQITSDFLQISETRHTGGMSFRFLRCGLLLSKHYSILQKFTIAYGVDNFLTRLATQVWLLPTILATSLVESPCL